MRTSTPLLAKQVSFKYGLNNASEVVQDFVQHGRKIARSHVREIAADVARISGHFVGGHTNFFQGTRFDNNQVVIRRVRIGKYDLDRLTGGDCKLSY